MKKSLIRYILLIIAGIAFLFMLFRDHIPFGNDNTTFAVSEGKDITGADLIQGDRKVSIRRSDNTWIVNRTKEARKSAVLFLIKTLKEIKIKSPVSADIFRSEIVDKKVEPVRVVVYSKRRPVKSFYVYRTGSNIYGNIMKMRINSKPFIVYMPGYEDNIGSHFIADELFWLPLSAFNLLPSQIESVQLQNVNDPQSSFSVVRRKSSFLLEDRNGSLAGWDSLKVRRYISYFTSVSFESWAFDLSSGKRRDIEASSPLFIFNVKKRDGGIIILKIWERQKDSGKSGEKDTDRVWAEKNDGNGIFVMRYFDLDPVLKKKSYFFGG